MIDREFFTYESYTRFLGKMKSMSEIHRFKDVGLETSGFILRHDVDFDLLLALDMATLEFENDVASTYFILTGCDTYNIFSKKNRDAIYSMLDMGHEIGLHFDPTLYPVDVNFGFEQEIALLSAVTGCEVQSVSLHQPSLHNEYPHFSGYKNAYDSLFFGPDRYLSDSCMNFRDKNPFEFIEKIYDLALIQVLLHPMHFSPRHLGYGEVTAETFIRNMNRFYQDWSVNKTFVEDIGPSYLDYFVRKVDI